MKPKKLLLVLVPILVLAFVTTANGYYSPFNERVIIGNQEDHPWGGEDGPTGDGPSHKVIRTDFIGIQFFYIDIIRIVISPNFNYRTNSNQSEGRIETDGILPDPSTNITNTGQGTSGKGN